ncbi:hypothetical protein [Adhaeribacter radiodurans]|uniref:STAS/SEC14 domain-containing protein n=1 Tax=Adhaeribacter radiodurans TaxID=2745197 RepID=A0A7L7L5K2_9BACT|nr:hypothetical protein [Adhaeribacter radiodurans]QMU28034.1 hypothetical protein HUW48_08240 [Adhaeribacter radiodurans]
MSYKLNLTLVYSSEFIKIEADREQDYLLATWLQQPTSATFREQLQWVTDYALANHINKALFDIRERAYLEVVDQNWLMREIMPLFKENNLRFAYLISKTTLAAMDIFRIQAAVEANMPGKNQMELNTFLNKDEAINWLMQTR